MSSSVIGCMNGDSINVATISDNGNLELYVLIDCFRKSRRIVHIIDGSSVYLRIQTTMPRSRTEERSYEKAFSNLPIPLHVGITVVMHINNDGYRCALMQVYQKVFLLVLVHKINVVFFWRFSWSI